MTARVLWLLTVLHAVSISLSYRLTAELPCSLPLRTNSGKGHEQSFQTSAIL